MAAPPYKRQKSDELRKVIHVPASMTTGMLLPPRPRSNQAGRSAMASLAKEADEAAIKAEKASFQEKYPKERILRLKLDFDDYDNDRSGLIDAKELCAGLAKERRELLRSSGLSNQRHSGTNVKQRLSSLGQSSLGAAMLHAALGGMRGDDYTDLAGKIFNVLDTDNDGKISFTEVLRVVHPRATPSEIHAMFGWTVPQGRGTATRKY